MKRKVEGEMSEGQAARIIETYENAIKNGDEWAHEVFLRRGTDKYERNLLNLNEAFQIKSRNTIIRPLKTPIRSTQRRRSR